MHSGTYTTGLQCYGSALQCYGSALQCYGSAFIRLSGVGSGSVLGMRIRIQEYIWNRPKFTNKPCYLPFKKGFVPLKVCFFLAACLPVL
jgi:hypothetical protein